MSMNAVSDADQAALSAWINHRHLGEAPARFRDRIDALATEHVVIDDFLVADKLIAIQRAFSEHMDFHERYRRFDEPERCDEAHYRDAEPKRRFYHHAESHGALDGHQLAADFLRHVKFLDALHGEAFLRYFSLIAGSELKRVLKVNTKRLCSSEGHHLDWHSDHQPWRRLCAVLYLTPDWRPEQGGLFEWREPDGREWQLEPIANRLVVFRPLPDHLHRVGELAADSPPRFNYTIWMGGTRSADSDSTVEDDRY